MGWGGYQKGGGGRRGNNTWSRGGRQNGRGGRTNGGGVYGGDDGYVETVRRCSRPDEHLSKQPARAYIGEQGPFFLNGCPTEADYFDPKAVVKTRTQTNCEGFNRLDYFWSIVAANTEAGHDAVTQLFTSVTGEASADEGQLQKAGIKYFVERFQRMPSIVEAATYLNVKSKNVTRNAHLTTEHVQNFVDFHAEETEDLHKAAVDLMTSAYRLYLFATSTVELTSLMLNLPQWADQVPLEGHPESVRRWKTDPMDRNKLLAVVNSSFEQRLRDERTNGTQSVGPSRIRYYGTTVSSRQRRNRRASRSPYDDDASEEKEEDAYQDDDDDRGSRKEDDLYDEGENNEDAGTRKRKSVFTKGNTNSSNPTRPEKKEVREPPKKEEKVNFFLEWSIDEVHEFEMEAQRVAVDADMATMEMKNFQAFIKKIPVPLRKHYKLPLQNQDYAVALANAAVVKEKVITMVKEVKTAYLKHTTSLVGTTTAKFQLDTSLEKGGILKLLALDSEYLLNLEDVKYALQELDNATEADRPTKQDEINEMEQRALREQVADFGTAQSMWESSVNFALKHHRTEPTREQAKEYLAVLDTHLRAALKISAPNKYDMRIKPKEWKGDVQRMFTVSYFAYVAWGVIV